MRIMENGVKHEGGEDNMQPLLNLAELTITLASSNKDKSHLRKMMEEFKAFEKKTNPTLAYHMIGHMEKIKEILEKIPTEVLCEAVLLTNQPLFVQALDQSPSDFREIILSQVARVLQSDTAQTSVKLGRCDKLLIAIIKLMAEEESSISKQAGEVLQFVAGKYVDALFSEHVSKTFETTFATKTEERRFGRLHQWTASVCLSGEYGLRNCSKRLIPLMLKDMDHSKEDGPLRYLGLLASMAGGACFAALYILEDKEIYDALNKIKSSSSCSKGVILVLKNACKFAPKKCCQKFDWFLPAILEMQKEQKRLGADAVKILNSTEEGRKLLEDVKTAST